LLAADKLVGTVDSDELLASAIKSATGITEVGSATFVIRR